jgi:2-polyprenyl-3-methyl-5-hydroxy-6-metoxy-1,4-benzoquinol methylase
LVTVRDDYHALVREKVLQLVPEKAGAVPDVGGGIGASAAYLKSLGRATSATVVDLVADQHLPEIDAGYGGNLEDPALLARIAEDRGPFDTILCLDVLEHLSDPWAVVDRLTTMLAPGGVIVASIPNMRNYRLVVPLVVSGRFELAESGILDRTHLRWFVRDTAIRLFTDAGLDVDRVVDHFEGPKKVMFNRLTLGLFKNFVTLQFYIRARKAG